LDIIYNIQQIGSNRFLFNYTVNSTTPVFILVITNPWTSEVKTVTLTTPDGDDGEWIFNIIGIQEAYEDLNAGEVFFPDIGTYSCTVSESGVLIKTITLQVVS